MIRGPDLLSETVKQVRQADIRLTAPLMPLAADQRYYYRGHAAAPHMASHGDDVCPPFHTPELPTFKRNDGEIFGKAHLGEDLHSSVIT